MLQGGSDMLPSLGWLRYACVVLSFSRDTRLQLSTDFVLPGAMLRLCARIDTFPVPSLDGEARPEFPFLFH